MTQLLQPPVSCKAILGSTLWVVPNVSSCLEGCHIVVVKVCSTVLGAVFERLVGKLDLLVLTSTKFSLGEELQLQYGHLPLLIIN